MAEPSKPDPIDPDPVDPKNTADTGSNAAPGDSGFDSTTESPQADAASSESAMKAPPDAPVDEIDADAAADAILAEAMATGKIAAPTAAASDESLPASGEASISAAELEAAMSAFKSGASNPAPASTRSATQPKPSPARDAAVDLGAAPYVAPTFESHGDDVPSGQLELLDDVELDVTVELGRAEMYIEDVLRLGVGSVVELDKLAGDPVEIYVNAQLVARGEVLVLNDNFCVRINDIVSPISDPEARK